MLPETVPFFAELMEDTSPEIEKLCKDILKHLDTLLGEGESISDYFQK